MSQENPLIAVIDDEEAVRKALQRLLRSVDLRVETFSGGEEFLAALGLRRPDCAVLDLQMPEMSGFDVLQRLAASGDRLPVVVITGKYVASAEVFVLAGGAASFLLKPVNDRVLLDAITAAIARAAPNHSSPPLPQIHRENPAAEKK
ncbi:MAG: response regulator [Verrucomicrobia bacterium]|nr:response regulator [Verrucomicrobiota bacterium]